VHRECHVETNLSKIAFSAECQQVVEFPFENLPRLHAHITHMTTVSVSEWLQQEQTD